MSNFKHDAQGFLVGELIEANKDLLASQSAGNGMLRRIRSDVSAIAKAMGAASRAGATTQKSSPSPSVRRAVAEPIGRTSRVAFTPRNSGNKTAAAVPRGRDPTGRFVAGVKQNNQPSDTKNSSNSDARDVQGRFQARGVGDAESGGGSRIADRLSGITEAIRGFSNSADGVDPTITALGEVKSVLEPLGRGAFALFGRSPEQKKERWYARILKALTGKKDPPKPTSPIFGGAAAAPEGGGGFFSSVLGGLIGGKGKALLGAAAGGGLLSKIFGGAKGALPAVAGEVGAVGAPAAGGLLGKAGGAMLKRIPWLGGLIAAGGALSSIFGGDDPAKSADENRTSKYKGVGEAGGMLAGGIVGAKGGAVLGALAGTLVGPVGTAVGGVVGGFLGGVGGALFGEVVGSKVGEWTKVLVDADIPGQMVKGWNVTTAAIGAAWASLAADAKTSWGELTAKAGAWWEMVKGGANKASENLKDAANNANTTVKNSTGVDIKQIAVDKAAEIKAGATSMYQDAKGVAGAAASKAADGASAALQATKTAASSAGSVIADTAVSAGTAMIPNTVKRAYSAGEGAATQARAGYDVARGNPSAAPEPVGQLQNGARAVGGAVGKGVNTMSNASLLLNAGVQSGITSPNELANFMGQNAHESGNFKTLKENTNFTPEQLLKNFKGRNGGINTIEEARAVHAGGQDSIGDAIYGGAWGKKNLGNTEEGDGLKFKGRGFTQITGRSNYAAAGKDLSLDLVNSPELAENPENAAKISAWYWKKRVAPKGAGEDVTMARKAINGGFNGLDDTKKKVSEWQEKIAAMPATSLPSIAQANVPMSVPSKIPNVPDVTMPPAAAPEKERPTVVAANAPVGQNMSDRTIAHIASGGIGSMNRW